MYQNSININDKNNMLNSTHKKRTKAEKNGDKDKKGLCKLMSNTVFRKIIENLRNRIDLNLLSNKKDYLKWTSKPSYMPHKIFDIDLTEIRKNKITNVYFRIK